LTTTAKSVSGSPGLFLGVAGGYSNAMRHEIRARLQGIRIGLRIALVADWVSRCGFKVKIHGHRQMARLCGKDFANPVLCLTKQFDAMPV
jgi:hypothetical protein